MNTATLGAWLVPLLVFSCGGGAELDLGSNGVSDGGSPDAQLASIIGSWTGHAEVITFPDGSDRIAATFARRADGSYTGTVTFGADPPPPAPTDPDVGYPPGFEGQATPQAYPGSPPVPVPSFSFAYTAANVTFDGTRLRFGLASYEFWRAWCELQTRTYATVPDSVFHQPWPYSCLPTPVGEGPESGGYFACAGQVGPDGGWVSVDCGKFDLCILMVVCSCTATSCTYDPTVDVLFDMQLTGDQLDGHSGAVNSQRSWSLYEGYPVIGLHLARSP